MNTANTFVTPAQRTTVPHLHAYRNSQRSQVDLASYYHESVSPTVAGAAYRGDAEKWATTAVSGSLPPSEIQEDVERPKIALRQGFRAALPHIVLHLISISIVFVVVQFSFRSHYWMDLRSPGETVALFMTQAGALNMLQFAAKLHELLVVSSLSGILLQAARMSLVGSRGLPFGLLPSCYQLGSVDYLWKSGFWSSWIPLRRLRGLRKKLVFVPFLLLFSACSILAVLIGPSSAIAIIPSLDWFPMRHPFNSTLPPYLIPKQPEELWPERVTSGSLPKLPCARPNATHAYSCPAEHMEEILSWAQAFRYTGLPLGLSNLSMHDGMHTNLRRVVSSNSCQAPKNSVHHTSASSLSAILSISVQSFWNNIKVENGGHVVTVSRPKLTGIQRQSLFAPHVNAICFPYVFTPSTIHNQTEMMFPLQNVIPDIDPALLQVPSYVWNFSRPLKDENFTWVQLPDFAGAPSIAALFTVPTIGGFSNGTLLQSIMQLPCTVDAKWIPVDISFDPASSDLVEYELSSSIPDSCLELPKTRRPSQRPKRIKIDTSWADAINYPVSKHPSSTNETVGFLAKVLHGYVGNSSSPDLPDGVTFDPPRPQGVRPSADIPADQYMQLIAITFSRILSMAVVDGLALLGSEIEPGFVTKYPNGTLKMSSPVTNLVSRLDGTDDELQDWLKLDFGVQRFGYGYSWNQSPTVRFGITVLLVYAALATGFILYVLHRTLIRREWTSGSWGNMGELLALAVNSTPSRRIQNTCAGITRRPTWRQIVSIRESHNTQHLELVFREDEMECSKLPKMGARYGTLPERV